MGYEMSPDASGRGEVPPHVKPDLVVDFNYFVPPGIEDDPHRAWKRLHEGPDIVYSPYNGGHWIATRADDIFAIMQDTETFSSREFIVPKRSPGTPNVIPNQLDPPQHGQIRSIILKPLAPKSIAPLEPMIREIMAARIARIASQGRCDFVAEFADVPSELFLRYARIPIEDLARVKKFADTVARSDSDADRKQARLDAREFLQDILNDRCRNPGEDLFSAIAMRENAGEITREQSNSIALNVFFGGLDTVASALGFVITFLAQSPEHRRQLIADPALSQDATEELLRRFGLLNLARTCTRRTQFKGATIEADELVMLPLHLANLDERKFKDPLTVDFKRQRSAHYNFGTGVHRCVGSNLARPEIRIFIEEWLKAIPEFSLDPDDKPVGQSGVVMAYRKVPLVWPTEATAVAAE
ncbi:cytochrome P450 [Sphingomonadaceae bacterium G21617-S1]|nr:cytochrome P450 [Sphingomonadaceae bacterium G21617-S1]